MGKLNKMGRASLCVAPSITTYLSWFHYNLYITTQMYTQIVTGRYARCVYLVFVFTMLLILRNIATLSETGKIEGKLATRVRKSLLILATKYKYKLYNLFFARLVSRIRSVYLSIFRTQCNSILYIIRN